MTRRRNRAEMADMETRVANLIGALRESGDEIAIDLAGRLWRCAKQRQERREGHEDRVWFPCRSVACPHCRRWRGNEWRRRAVEQMHRADNDHSSMVTVMLEKAGDFDTVRQIVLDTRTALRNLRDRQIKRDARWRGLEIVGLAELDMVSPDDILLLPPERQAVVRALPARTYSPEMVIVAHMHLAVSHPAIPRHAVERIFMQQWQGQGRVDVRELHDDIDAPENCGGIVAYAAKHSMVTKFDGDVELAEQHDRIEAIEMPVPLEWQAQYWTWLHRLGCGISPLRFRMSAVKDHVYDAAEVVEKEFIEEEEFVEEHEQDDAPEPLPFIIGSRWAASWASWK